MNYIKSFVLAAVFAVLTTNVFAQTCVTQPDCAALGYTQSVENCNGKNMIHCFFDTSKVFCGGSSCPEGKECEFGCQSYSSVCPDVCETCYSDNCHNRTDIGTCSYGCETYFSDCASKCESCYADNCHKRTDVGTCNYGCKTYFSDCASKCKACYTDNCLNRESKSCNFGCDAYYSDCSSKCKTCVREYELWVCPEYKCLEYTNNTWRLAWDNCTVYSSITGEVIAGGDIGSAGCYDYGFSTEAECLAEGAKKVNTEMRRGWNI